MPNNNYKDQDMALWEQYREAKSPAARTELLKRFEPLIHSQVQKWDGIVPRDVLNNEAKVLTAKAIDSYDPSKGAALGTHVTNNLAPLSRTVYTYQNTARLPENITLRMQSYEAARDHLVSTLGREPTTDELRDELGWTANEINRIQQYNRKDLVESGGAVSGDFYATNDDDEDAELAAIYFSLMPEEKKLFEDMTGYNGAQKLSTQQILTKHNLTQAQLSYKKSLLTRKIQDMRQGA